MSSDKAKAPIVRLEIVLHSDNLHDAMLGIRVLRKMLRSGQLPAWLVAQGLQSLHQRRRNALAQAVREAIYFN